MEETLEKSSPEKQISGHLLSPALGLSWAVFGSSCVAPGTSAPQGHSAGVDNKMDNIE